MSAERELTAIEEAAAGWMVEHDRGLSPDRERELALWLEADVRHAAAFNALAETWALIGESRPEVADDYEPVFAGRRPRPAWIAATLAAAAAVLVCLGWWRLEHVGTADTAAPFAQATIPAPIPPNVTASSTPSACA